MNLENLNDKQREAATAIDGPLLILAGAGSGKTQTMTHRIAYMVDKGINPANILAVTFTNKAAKEMKERVEALIGDTGHMWIMTFHAMCLRILRRNAEEAGYQKNFVIYDPQDQKTIIKQILSEYNIDTKNYPPVYFLSTISKLKEGETGPESYLKSSSGIGQEQKIYAVYKEYEKRLKRNNAMDFDDLLFNTSKLFEKNHQILEIWRSRFRYIMVDEYQDTNYLQYKIIKLLSKEHHNICVVGDDDQCIYQWRGADIRNILDFEKDFPEAEVIKLEENYRSTGNILSVAHSVIENNKQRKKKKLWTKNDEGRKVTYRRADDDFEEARFVANEIAILKNADMNYGDFAILYRTNSQSRQFEEALRRQGIPHQVLSGLKFYDRKEIKDLIAYMRLLVNPNDDVSLERVINEPKRGVGKKSLERIRQLAEDKGIRLFEAISDDCVTASLSSKIREAVKEFAECLQRAKEIDTSDVMQIYEYLLDKTGYLVALQKVGTIESESRIDNLMEFKSVIYEYVNNTDEPSLEEFMEGLALMADVDADDGTGDGVNLMTLHSAKGLEFPVVFIVGMEDGLFPGQRAFKEPNGIEEERRLCYVGMTRAKERLFLTGATVRTLYGNRDYTRESQFLRELDPHFLEGDGIYDKKSERKAYSSGISGPGVFTGGIDGYSDEKMKGYRPFDSERYSEKKGKSMNMPFGFKLVDYDKRTKNEKSVDDIDFSIGERVRHKKFGEGTIEQMTDRAVSVRFDSGETKRLARGVAPLEKI